MDAIKERMESNVTQVYDDITTQYYDKNTILPIVYFKAYKHVMYLMKRMIFPQEQRNTSEICKVNVKIYRDVQNERY